MRELLIKFFSEGSSEIEITLFSIWHILYIILIVGAAIGLGIYLRKKNRFTQDKVLSAIAVAIPVIYIADFFIMPLARSSFDIDIDKLPFHVCTLMGILVPFVHFNKRFEKLKTPVTCLGLVASLMYITYPGSALGGLAPWCYKIVQTFLYHGLLLIYGYVSIATDKVKLEFKNIYKELLLIMCVIVWASFGNNVYSNSEHHYDWFFVTGSTFPFVPAPLMPFVVLICVFAMCNIIYGINYGVRKLIERKNYSNKAYNNEEEKETSTI